MILRNIVLKKKKKRTSLSAMLNSDLFLRRSIQIQMALNQDRLLPRDYLIQKAKPKINTGKKKKINDNDKNKDGFDSSFEANREKDKRLIPDELDKILHENQKKFAVQNKKYRELKDHNDAISSFWHYINKTNKQQERELLFKKYFSKDDKNIINLYSDKLQKLTLNLFKTNPLLLRKKNAEMFFHYLSEFNKYYNDDNKYIYVKQKIISFLEKLRDYLEFVKIKSDNTMDSISKDIKIKNSKFFKEFEEKVKNEMRSLNEKRKIINNNDIKECEKLIKKTKRTINTLFENKHFFDDPSYFDPMYSKKNNIQSRNKDFIYKYNYHYQNNSSSPNLIKDNNNYNNNIYNINTYSPNKTFKMSTISTGFYAPEKNKDTNNKQNNDILVNDINSNIKNIKYKMIAFDKNIRKSRRSISSKNTLEIKNNLIDNLNEPKKIKKLDFNHINGIEIEKNSDMESISSSIDINDNDKKKKKIMKNNFSSKIINNFNSKRKSEEENILKFLSNISSSKQIYYPKKSRHSSVSIIRDKDTSKDSGNGFRKKSIIIKASDKRNSRICKNNPDITKKTSNKKDNNSMNSLINFNKYRHYNNDIGKEPISVIYENIKDKEKIKEADVDKINVYLNKTGKKFNNNLKSMDIIRQAKIITDRLDVEKKTKKVFQPYLSYEQILKLDDVKNVNKNLFKLDIDYMNRIFDYKSKSSDNIQLYDQE